MVRAGSREGLRGCAGIMAKNLFATKLFWGVVFTLFLAVGPKLEELESRRFTLRDWIQVFSALASAGLVLLDFHAECGRVYTSNFLPGRNRCEVNDSQE
jgi:hypothetical protein